MKLKFFNYLLAAAATVGMTSCKDDISLDIEGPGQPKTEYDGEYVYMSLGLQLNSSSNPFGRSSTNTDADADYGTSTGGTEYGSLEEHDVRTAIIVLAKTGTYDYIAHAEVTGIITGQGNENVNGGSEGNFSFSTVGRFKYSDIAKLYDDETGDLKDEYTKGVSVFAFCNPTGDLLYQFESTDFTADPTSWIDWMGEVLEEPSLPGFTPVITNSIWAPRSFLMSNAKPAFAELPGKLRNWDIYNLDNPFGLSDKNEPGDPDNSEAYGDQNGLTRGPIYVERAVARVDLKPDYSHLTRKDGSKITFEDEANPEWRYPILGGLSSSVHDGTTDNGDGDGTSFNFIDVKLTRASLVNMSKNYYFLRRVSANGLGSNSTVMGVERTNNYVVDTDADTKQAVGGYNEGNASTGFNFALFTNKAGSIYPDFSREFAYDRNGWYSDNILDIMKGKRDNSSYTSSEPNDYYRVWRYMTENTIPADDAGGTSRQVAVQSTGIVFKGLLLPGADIDYTYEYEEGIATADDASSAATTELRYVPVEVVNALLASKHHLPRRGTDEGQNMNPLWVPDNSMGTEEKNAFLKANGKDNYTYNYPTLYVYQGSIYAGFNTVVQSAELYDGIGGLMYSAVSRVLSQWWCNLDDLDNPATSNIATFVYKGNDFDAATTDGNWLQLNVEYYNKIVNGHTHGEPIVPEVTIDETSKRFAVDLDEFTGDFRAMLTNGSEASSFTLYDASYEEEDRGGAGYGYYCYYFWWFKHNDNGIDGRMGPMEFATVRNNVYKLSVTKITSLGHSMNTLNDPDPLIPETPDEEDRIYFDVDLKIMPWVVRNNSVQF